MSQAADTVITTLLFVFLAPAVGLACWMGFVEAMRGFKGKSTSRAYLYSFASGAIGVPLSAIMCYVTAIVVACVSGGYTFYYPLIALVVGVMANRLLFLIADIFRKKYEDSADIWNI
ncbi:MAG: hypothetical protein ACRDTI_09450 [Mycobacterium sp.]